MKAITLRTGIIIAAVVSILALLALFSKASLGYWRFINRSPEYYAEFARACDKILADHKRDLPTKVVGEKLRLLPKLVADLAPSAVLIDTNQIAILVGGGGDGYHIYWVSPEESRGVWSLRANRDGSTGTVVFSQKKQ